MHDATSWHLQGPLWLQVDAFFAGSRFYQPCFPAFQSSLVSANRNIIGGSNTSTRMTRGLSKVTKKISKKRKGNINNLHQNSRDAQRLRRAGAREEKMSRLLDAATRANQFYVDRVEWFKSALEGSEGPLTDGEMRVLTEGFLGRDEDDLVEAQQQRRPGRPPSKVEERILERKDAEDKEYRGGLWVPELRDDESRQKIERWGGDWSGLNSLKFVRIVKDGTIKPSSFPPKGLS